MKKEKVKGNRLTMFCRRKKLGVFATNMMTAAERIAPENPVTELNAAAVIDECQPIHFVPWFGQRPHW